MVNDRLLRLPTRSPRARALVAAVSLVAVAGSAAAQVVDPPPRVTTTTYDMSRVAVPPSLTPVEFEGKKLFVQRCALCHDVLGQPASTTVGPWVDATTVKARGEAAVKQKILQGSRRMPGWKHTLDERQVDAVIAYMKTVTPDQKPKAGGPVTGPIE